jgi:hypothetical protein
MTANDLKLYYAAASPGLCPIVSWRKLCLRFPTTRSLKISPPSPHRRMDRERVPDLQPGPARRHARRESRESPRGASGRWAARDHDAKAGPRTVAGMVAVLLTCERRYVRRQITETDDEPSA